MRLCLVRHATLLLDYAGLRLIVDPMLDDLEARPPILSSPNPRNNPLVPLPMAAEEVVQGVEAVLVTHTHSDHWDATAARLLPKQVPLFGQTEDEAKFRSQGFTVLHSVAQPANWNGIQISRTSGQYGRGEIATEMAPVSGFVLQAAGEPTLDVAGDTIWCNDVQQALRAYKPAIVVVNTGAAQFLEGDPITMTAEDVMATCQAVPEALVVAVHMEAINHCLLTRSDLAFQLEAARMIGQVAIPQDGGWVDAKA